MLRLRLERIRNAVATAADKRTRTAEMAVRGCMRSSKNIKVPRFVQLIRCLQPAGEAMSDSLKRKPLLQRIKNK